MINEFREKGEGGHVEQLKDLWVWLSFADNRDILKLIGGVIATLGAGLWVLYTYFKQRRTSRRLGTYIRL